MIDGLLPDDWPDPEDLWLSGDDLDASDGVWFFYYPAGETLFVASRGNSSGTWTKPDTEGMETA